MTKMLSVCYEYTDRDSAALMVFDQDMKSPKILTSWYGDEATKLFKKLTERDDDQKSERSERMSYSN